MWPVPFLYREVVSGVYGIVFSMRLEKPPHKSLYATVLAHFEVESVLYIFLSGAFFIHSEKSVSYPRGVFTFN
ncbi:hypothetical protein SAMN04490247_2124 [Salimicrobium halophilum]|uniref:Uncharacterized protein n=1 Tax=Salimicrobium halophilum TaxID=86666 RepID=A0A1G8U9G6_9BACI|nr:hypothetical protein SAMN04490247_2124 [Salimicrobium halophilum]